MCVVLILVAILTIILIVEFFRSKNAAKIGERRLKSYNPEQKIISGVQVSYLDRGSGPALLSLHGMAGGFDQSWENVKEHKDQFRIIAPSRFGYPGSGVPNDKSVKNQIDIFVGLLDELNIDKTFVLGTSAGGTYAIRFALDYPERCLGLILYCSAPPLTTKPKPDTINRYQGPPAFLVHDYPMWLIRGLFPIVMSMPSSTINIMMPIEARHEGFIIDSTIANPDMAVNYDDYLIEDLHVDTIIFHAKDDKLASFEAMEEVSHRFPNLKFIKFETGGHLMSGHSNDIKRELHNFVKLNSTNS